MQAIQSDREKNYQDLIPWISYSILKLHAQNTHLKFTLRGFINRILFLNHTFHSITESVCSEANVFSEQIIKMFSQNKLFINGSEEARNTKIIIGVGHQVNDVDSSDALVCEERGNVW